MDLVSDAEQRASRPAWRHVAMNRSTITIEHEQGQGRTSPRLPMPEPARVGRSDSAVDAVEEEPDGGEPDFQASCRVAARYLL
jgi:hypothetical protein